MTETTTFFFEHWFNGGDTCECGYWAHLDSVKRHHLEDALADWLRVTDQKAARGVAEVIAAHRWRRLPGGYVGCTCGGGWNDHREHVAAAILAHLHTHPTPGVTRRATEEQA